MPCRVAMMYYININSEPLRYHFIGTRFKFNCWKDICQYHHFHPLLSIFTRPDNEYSFYMHSCESFIFLQEEFMYIYLSTMYDNEPLNLLTSIKRRKIPCSTNFKLYLISLNNVYGLKSCISLVVFLRLLLYSQKKP